jgi:hypothetical protein
MQPDWFVLEKTSFHASSLFPHPSSLQKFSKLYKSEAGGSAKFLKPKLNADGK